MKRKLLGGANVVGTDITTHETEQTTQYAIQVYLKHKTTAKQLEKMEKEIDGIPILYRTIGAIRALS